MNNYQKALLGVLLCGILFTVVGYLGVSNDFLQIIIASLLVLAMFSSSFSQSQGTVRNARIVLTIIALCIFVSSWGFTKVFAKSKRHEVQTLMSSKSETVDPESEVPKPGKEGVDLGIMTKFMRRPDGVIEKVPVEWRRNKYTGLALAEPSSKEYWELLNEYEVQEAERREAEEGTGKNRVQKPGIEYLTPEEPVKAFTIAGGQTTASYEFKPNWAPVHFDVVITEGVGTLIINGKYRLEEVKPKDPRLEDLRGKNGPVPGFDSITSYQLVGGPVTGLIQTTWRKKT